MLITRMFLFSRFCPLMKSTDCIYELLAQYENVLHCHCWCWPFFSVATKGSHDVDEPPKSAPNKVRLDSIVDIAMMAAAARANKDTFINFKCCKVKVPKFVNRIPRLTHAVDSQSKALEFHIWRIWRVFYAYQYSGIKKHISFVFIRPIKHLYLHILGMMYLVWLLLVSLAYIYNAIAMFLRGFFRGAQFCQTNCTGDFPWDPPSAAVAPASIVGNSLCTVGLSGQPNCFVTDAVNNLTAAVTQVSQINVSSFIQILLLYFIIPKTNINYFT